MNKETLTVEKSKRGTITYRNADGERHNPHGPAVIDADGDEAYYINGKRQNPHGPAIVWPDGSKAHWTKVKKLTEVDIKAWQAEQAAK